MTGEIDIDFVFQGLKLRHRNREIGFGIRHRLLCDLERCTLVIDTGLRDGDVLRTTALFEGRERRLSGLDACPGTSDSGRERSRS